MSHTMEKIQRLVGELTAEENMALIELAWEQLTEEQQTLFISSHWERIE